MRKTVSILIVSFWLAMVAALVRRTWVPAPTNRSAVQKAAGADRDEWMSVYHEGLKIGYTRSLLSADAASGGFAFAEESLLRLVVMERPQTVRTRLRGHTASDLSLRDVEFELRSGAWGFAGDRNRGFRRAAGDDPDRARHLRTGAPTARAFVSTIDAPRVA